MDGRAPRDAACLPEPQRESPPRSRLRLDRGQWLLPHWFYCIHTPSGLLGAWAGPGVLGGLGAWAGPTTVFLTVGDGLGTPSWAVTTTPSQEPHP